MRAGWCLVLACISYVSESTSQQEPYYLDQYSLYYRDGYASVGNRILGGRPTTIDLVPYQVHYNGRCGGAILSPLWIITAAHCDPLPNGSYVMVGATNKKEGTRFNVSTNIYHPEWKKVNSVEMDYDYQLLLLTNPIPITKSTMPIGLAHMEALAPGTLMEVTGWGRTTEDAKRSSPILMSVKVPIISHESCASLYSIKGVEVTDRMLCAGYSEGKKDSCKGDSGGPAVVEGRLAGIVSFGIGCGQPDLPGVYSNVPYVADWIHGVTGINPF